jgi:hypothetical protein
MRDQLFFEGAERGRRLSRFWLLLPLSAVPPLAVVGLTLVEAIGPNPAPGLALLRHDLNAADPNGLNVRVSLVPASYQPLPG